MLELARHCKSCKIAFLQLFRPFFEKYWSQKFWCFFLGWIFLFIQEALSLFFGGMDLNSLHCRSLIPIFFVGYGSQQIFFQKPYPYFFWGGMDLNNLYFRNLIPIFWGGMDLNSFYFRNLIPFFCRVWISTVFLPAYPYFLGEYGSQQFVFQKPYPYFFGWYGSQQFFSQKPYPYFFFGGGMDLNSFDFRNLISIFFWGGMDRNSFLPETLSLFFLVVWI